MITGNLNERILKFRKTVHPFGSRDTKTNFFTPSKFWNLNPFILEAIINKE